MYQFYILPLKQHYGTGYSEPSRHTPQTTSGHASKQYSVIMNRSKATALSIINSLPCIVVARLHVIFGRPGEV